MDIGLITCGTCHITQLTHRITKPQKLIQRETQTHARKLISNNHDAQVQTTNSLYSATSESVRSSCEFLLFCGISNNALGNSRIQSVVWLDDGDKWIGNDVERKDDGLIKKQELAIFKWRLWKTTKCQDDRYRNGDSN